MKALLLGSVFLMLSGGAVIAAEDHNSTRSNESQSAVGPASDGSLEVTCNAVDQDCDSDVDSRAAGDHNTTRSNRTPSITNGSDAMDGDPDRPLVTGRAYSDPK